MGTFLGKRLAFALVTLFLVLTLVFVIVRILPGDPVLVVLGDQASPASVAALRSRLGLDGSIIAQYGRFLLQVLKGDLGESLVSGRPVSREILAVLPYTIELTVSALLLGIVLGVPAGVWSAVRHNRLPDYFMRLLSLVGLSLPGFVAGIVLLMLFAIQFRIFPVISSGGGTVAERLRQLRPY